MSKMEQHDNFQFGDDVMCPPRWSGAWVRGTVSGVTPGTVQVELLTGSTEVYRRHKYGRPFACRKRTEQDQREEEYERALEDWKRAAPKPKTIRVRDIHGARVAVTVSAVVEVASDIDVIEADLALVREWLRKRPVEPSSV